MKFLPLVPLWFIALYGLFVVGVIGWQFWQLSRQRRRTQIITKTWIRRAVQLLLPLLIAIGPSIQGGISAPGITNVDVVFAIDTTPSIAALDYVGGKQRLEGVKQDLLSLGEQLQGAHIEIITFDSNASVILPPTTDQTVFTTTVRGLTPQISSYSEGSNIGEPIKIITQELNNMKTVYPEHYRMLFFISDGEQTAGDSVESFAALKEYINGGAVLGYGTEGGARMPKFNGLDFGKENAPDYIKTVDPSSNKETDAISKGNPGTLKQIASDLGVEYQDRTSGGSIDSAVDASKVKSLVDRSQKVVHYFNLYWLIAIPYAALIMAEWLQIMTKLLEARQRKEKEEQKEEKGKA